MTAPTVRCPAGLGAPGKAMWRSVTSSIEFEDPRELIALRKACQLEDDLDRLRGELEDATLVVKGSTGQPVETPLLGAIRNGIALQARLLGSIALDSSSSARSHAGRALAGQRWNRG